MCKHKLLLALYGEKRGTDIMAAGWLQRWVIFLSILNYGIKYIDVNQNITIELFQIPVVIESMNNSEVQHVYFMDKLPVDFRQIRSAAGRDLILIKI